MKKIHLSKIKFLAAVAMAGLFVSCPIHNPGSLVFLETMAMTRQNQCTIQAKGGSQYIRPFGILDLALTNHYFLFPHLHNNMPSSLTINKSSAENLDVESNYMNILGADVKLDIPMDIYKDKNVNKSVLYPAMTDGFFTGASGGILPDSEAMTAIELIPPAIGKELKKAFQAKINADGCSAPSADIYAYVTIDGVTITGNKVRSNSYMFPLKLCWGCLVRYISDNPKSIVPQGASTPCLPGQDEAVSNVLCVHVVPPIDQDICYPDRSCASSN